MTRIIPAVMATQHPDNARRPYWQHRAFVTTAEEIKECFLCFSELDIGEYNWDWEGKFVDEAVVDRLMTEHYRYFSKQQLADKKFLTFRIPNPRVEKQFRLARAFMVAITSSQLAKELQQKHAPVFEMILPLTETADEMIEIQRAYHDLVAIEHRLLQLNNSLKHIEIIPLFEQVSTIVSSTAILEEYVQKHEKVFGFAPEYIRPYCARSDPALNSGLIPTMLGLAIALSDYQKFTKKTGIATYPMVGTGSLPFRGGVTPDNVETVLKKYRGVRTLTLQSAFRYDYPRTHVERAVQELNKQLPRTKAQSLTASDRKKLVSILPDIERPYRRHVEKLAPLISLMGTFVPQRRERMLHVGLFGYSRGINGVRLPRAIGFTAALYSIGVPPEIIGAGSAIAYLKKYDRWELAQKYYPHIIDDVQQAARYINTDVVRKLDAEIPGLQLTKEVNLLEQQGIVIGPQTAVEREHQRITSRIYQHITTDQPPKVLAQLITRGGKLRKSLG